MPVYPQTLGNQAQYSILTVRKINIYSKHNQNQTRVIVQHRVTQIKAYNHTRAIVQHHYYIKTSIVPSK